MDIEERGLIRDATRQPVAERIAFFTSLCVLKSGIVLAGYQVGRRKHAADGTIRLARSDDGGRHWRELPFAFATVLDEVPGSLAAAELVETSPGRLLLFSTWFNRSEPHRPLFDPVTEGILHSRQLLAESCDEGNTWSDWREVPTPDLSGCALTGPVLAWHDGSLGFAFESFKEFDDPRPGRHAAWLMVSRDAGQTFDPPWRVAQHPEHSVYYWDQRMCPVGASGEFIGLFWTHDLAAKRDLAVHFRRGSVASGKTGDLPRPTPLPGQIAAPCLLPDGRLLAFVVDRDVPGTMTLWSSPDEGHTWPQDKRLVIHEHVELARLATARENVDFAAYWEDMGKWTLGHPAIRLVTPDVALLAYYAGTPEALSIHWARVRL